MERKGKTRNKYTGVMVLIMISMIATVCCSCVSDQETAKADDSFSVRATMATYGAEGGFDEGNTREEKEALLNFGGNGVNFPEFLTYWWSYDKCSERDVTVKDVAQLDGDVHYVAEGLNGVVVSKWLYYHSALSYYTGYSSETMDYRQRYYDPDEKTTEASQDPRYSSISAQKNVFSYKYPGACVAYENAPAVYYDEYCMEQVVMDVFALKKTDGRSMREMSAEEADALARSKDASYFIDCELFSLHPDEVVAAAFARYGALTVPDEPTEEGWLYIDGKWVRVVGYYETEADKLLSKGVSMDENSDEYKLVLAQLKNTVVYSTMGNFVGKKAK